MKPYYDRMGITIFHGDCRDVLPMLDRADLMLTDPPYGLDSPNLGRDRHWANSLHDPAEWDSEPVSRELLGQCIAAALGAIVWGGNFFDLPPAPQWLVWDKIQPELYPGAMCDLAWTNLDGTTRIFQRRTIGFERWHPTQKPVELMRWCLELVPDARTILDPFMGSGTTLRAAMDLGREAIGIEREERYCEVAVERLRQEVLL